MSRFIVGIIWSSGNNLTSISHRKVNVSGKSARDVVVLSVINSQLHTMEEDPGSSAGILATQTDTTTEEPKGVVDSTEAQIKMVEDFTEGFLSAFLPEVGNLQERLSELTQNQGILIETMQQENSKFEEYQVAKDLAAVLSQVHNYHNKLNKIKQDMATVQERVARLKKRATKLQGQKEKEEKNKEDARTRQLEIERQLMAKVASDYKG